VGTCLNMLAVPPEIHHHHPEILHTCSSLLVWQAVHWSLHCTLLCLGAEVVHSMRCNMLCLLSLLMCCLDTVVVLGRLQQPRQRRSVLRVRVVHADRTQTARQLCITCV
jgi:hypothetical protein